MKNQYLTVKILSLLVVLSSLSLSFAQNTTDTNNYTISSPDNSLSLSLDPYGARAVEFHINGDWNRLKTNISLTDRSNQIKIFDFNLGTYTDVVTNDNRPRYQVEQSDNSLSLYASTTIDGKELTINRKITLLEKGQAQHHIVLSNTSKQEISLNFEGLAFSTASLFDFAKIAQNNNITEMKYFDGKKVHKAKVSGSGFFSGPKPMDIIPNIEWISVADNFFMYTVQPNISNAVAVYHGLEFGQKSRTVTGIQVLATNLAPNQTIELSLSYYIGPRSESLAKLSNPEFKKLFSWPWLFQWMLKPIEAGTYWLIDFLNNATKSPGLTLILIALIIKLLLLPLSIKSAISMKKMRVLQPKLNKLQEKWGYDPQLLQQKTLELYKTEKANPMGGCLPLLLQIPVFFALFRVLSRSVQLRGAEFLWINDLTMPDSLFMIGSFSFNLLPLIMTLLQLVSVFLQQGRGVNTQNEMQKQMQTQGYIMPVVFLFLFWNMPSGLVLYWTVQNVFSIVEQEVINLDSRFANKHISY